MTANTVLESPASSSLLLEGPLDISNAAELKERLRQAMAASSNLTVSLAAVTALDLPSAQLLWAARRDAALSGRQFTFTGPLAAEIAARLAAGGIALDGPALSTL